MRLNYYIGEQLQAEALGPASCVNNKWDVCILGSGSRGEGVAVEGDEINDGCYIVGGIFAWRGVAGIVSAEGGGGIRVCEWGADNGGCEEVEGKETGRGELGLAGITVKVGDGCVEG